MTLSRFVPAALRNQGAVISRILAASLGGYVLTNTAAVLIAFLLPMPKVQSVATMMLGSFALFSAIVIWVYATASLRRVWLIMGPAIVISLLIIIAMHMTGAV